MSDTFAFRTIPVPLYRRVNLRVLKAVVVSGLVLATVGAFARWTIRSEQESFAAAAHQTASQAAAAIRAPAADPSVVGLQTSGIAVVAAVDLAAQNVVRHTLGRAQRLFSRQGSFIEAGPGQLSRGSKGLTFTDGPSIGPTIVSVAGSDATWGAAVMSESGLCFAMRLDPHGAARYGTLSSACSGNAALQVKGVSW